MVDAARIAALEAELVKEAARTAEQKLRADQMTRQHADQCAMTKDLQKRVQELGQMARDCSSRRVLELEAMLASVGAGGVQALVPKSAAMPDLAALTERGAVAWAGVDAQPIHLAWRGALKACGVSDADCEAISAVVLSMLSEPIALPYAPSTEGEINE